ncbi:MAG TPA: hypothetical protein VLL08_05650 [Kineosporiaceae bacterium]|nr:hypothetical protein [Kineosporiaceae bacterium]
MSGQTQLSGQAQRKIVLALMASLTGLGFGLVAVVHHDGRQMIARWILLVVVGLWLAVAFYRDGKQPKQPRRRWGEGSSAPVPRLDSKP